MKSSLEDFKIENTAMERAALFGSWLCRGGAVKRGAQKYAHLLCITRVLRRILLYSTRPQDAGVRSREGRKGPLGRPESPRRAQHMLLRQKVRARCCTHFLRR